MTRILIVDDSRVTREVVKVFLIAPDVLLLEAEDGADAVAKAQQLQPDIVLADMRMPRLDGAGLCAALRLDPSTRHIPVLILTSSQDAATRERAVAAGAREVLQKPVQPAALLAALQRHLTPAHAGTSPGALR